MTALGGTTGRPGVAAAGAVVAAVAALLGACGDGRDASRAATTSIPEVGVGDPGDGTARPDGPELVTATPGGLVDVRPHPWTAAELRDGGRTLVVQFEDGPSECHRLARVEVAPLGDRVVVTVFTGRVPGTECPDAGVPKAVEVLLSDPLATVASVVDGSTR